MAAASVRNVVKDRLVRNGWTIGLNMMFSRESELLGYLDDDALIIPRTSLVIAVSTGDASY
jgi:hypothetical protein